LAATYAIRPILEPFATLTGDYRDVDLRAGWDWLALEASYGNGFLDTLEHRRPFKVNALRGWNIGAHKLTLLFIGEGWPHREGQTEAAVRVNFRLP
jgi:hypothetical protein